MVRLPRRLLPFPLLLFPEGLLREALEAVFVHDVVGVSSLSVLLWRLSLP
jgi:hypothetical protein